MPDEDVEGWDGEHDVDYDLGYIETMLAVTHLELSERGEFLLEEYARFLQL